MTTLKLIQVLMKICRKLLRHTAVHLSISNPQQRQSLPVAIRGTCTSCRIELATVLLYVILNPMLIFPMFHFHIITQ